jgi:hypothetical protein
MCASETHPPTTGETLMDEKELRLIFEQAWLPVTLDAVMEQLTMPMILAIQDIVISLHETHHLDADKLALKLSASAKTCPEGCPRSLLETMASNCLRIAQGATPEAEFQTPSRSVPKLIWSNPDK